MKKKVCIQGLGFVGFAMAIAVAKAKDKTTNLPLYDVVGVDLPTKDGKQKISAINKGTFPISCNDEELKKAYEDSLREGNIRASNNTKEFENADIVIVDINLDVSINGKSSEVDFSPLKKAIETVGVQIKKDTLVIIETTVPPGTTEKIIYPILKEILSERFNMECIPILAHSYERVMPGPQYLSSIINFWRVYAGINKKSANKCKEFLSTIINTEDYKLSELSSTTASELSKVLENSYRASNIAFIHEWGLFAEKVGVNLFEVIKAIKLRPTHSNINRPGLGVGGYCLTKDPLMGFVSSNQIFKVNSTEFPITEKSIDINSQMPRHSFNITLKNLDKIQPSTKILILGISYRDQVGDIRYSASIELAKMFIENNIIINTHDPMVEDSMPSELGFLKELPNPNNFKAIIFTVAHLYYKDLNLENWLKDYTGLIIDSNNVLEEKTVNQLNKMNLTLKIIGRGDI